MSRSRNVGKFSLVLTRELTAHSRNPRRHTRQQIRAIANSIEAFGFNAPILVDKDNRVIAGHGRLEAAKLIGLVKVPVVSLAHLTEAQANAYMLADNKLTDRSSWDDAALASNLKELSTLAVDFDIEAMGFEQAEIDLRILSSDDVGSIDRADEFELIEGPGVSVPGEVWVLGPHLLTCGNALDAGVYDQLFKGEKAAGAFTDPPFNIPINGNVSGNGRTTHREFPMGVGEMSEAEFTAFLTTSLMNICRHLVPGALLYACMDWRHMVEMLGAGRAAGCDLINLCVWAKSNGGMGSFYRSGHELVFVFRNGAGAHVNNVQLGRFGRNRTNVWNYPSVNSFGRGRSTNHPTIKPIGLVADAIQDSTKRDDIVLDPYVGSGTTLLAAEHTNRRCYCVELDPVYVDTTIERWQQMTGGKAHTRFGETYEQLKGRRSVRND
jgi:DNA modification methylase